jgi:hypothetical protein
MDEKNIAPTGFEPRTLYFAASYSSKLETVNYIIVTKTTICRMVYTFVQLITILWLFVT